MFIITLKGMEDSGAYSVKDELGQKVVFMFEEEDDADRYAMMMKEEGDKDMVVIEVQDSVAITACERDKIRYTIITKNDIVIPPQDDD
tara:strand:- start:578 stop:841 length:264 start_codon:yes stop_codon:yes gene_type:complete